MSCESFDSEIDTSACENEDFAIEIQNEEISIDASGDDDDGTIAGDVDRATFYRRINEILKTKCDANSFLIPMKKYKWLIEQVKKAKVTKKKTPTDFRRAKRYEVVKTIRGERLFLALQKGQTKQQEYVPMEEMYDIIRNYHISLNHGGRSRMMIAIKKVYKNITAQAVLLYLSLCKDCKNYKSNKRGSHAGATKDNTINELNQSNTSIDPLNPVSVVQNSPIQPDQDSLTDKTEILFPELYPRGQFDILEVTTAKTERFKYLMVYRNYVTKYTHLKALASSSTEEIVEALLEIFLIFGAPNILQSMNGLAVTKPICRRAMNLCPELKIVVSDMSFTETEFGGKSNESILQKLNDWLEINKNSKWQCGLKYVQRDINSTFHPILCRTPNEVVFGAEPRKGLASVFSSDECDMFSTEDELRKYLEEKDQEQESKHIKLKLSLLPPNNLIKLEPENFDDDEN